MKFDTLLLTHNLRDAAHAAKRAEEIGFDGLWTAETQSDPLLPLTIAAEHTQNITLGTAITVAFPRSPMVLAMMAWDLQRFSNGRFTLGLGTQVRAHNERRFGVKWEKPVRKLRETVEAMHAIWDCWQNGTRLNYEGEFFKLNLMTPFFNGGPLEVDRPKVFISAVNQNMLRLVGRLCDGAHIHSFCTEKYLRDYALPQIEVGLRDKGRTRSDIQLNSSIFTIPTDGAKPAAHYEKFAREQIAFYMSTPAYRIVNEIHGWEATALQLSKLARSGGWAEMPKLITDEMLDAFAISGTWAELPRKVNERYGDVLDRVGYYLTFTPGEMDEAWRASVAGFRALAQGE